MDLTLQAEDRRHKKKMAPETTKVKGPEEESLAEKQRKHFTNREFDPILLGGFERTVPTKRISVRRV